MQAYDMIIKIITDLVHLLKDGLLLQLSIGVAFVVMWRWAWRIQVAVNQHDFMSIILGPDGQISQVKVQQVIAFVVVTWIVILYSYRGTLSEMMFGLYFGFTTAAVALNRYFNKDFTAMAQPTTVTASVPTGASATVTATAPTGDTTGAAPDVTVTTAPKTTGE